MQLPVASTQPTGLWSALGLNWWNLAINALAFLIVAWVLGRYVYPMLLKALNAKADEFARAGQLKQEAEQALSQAQAETQKLISQARQEAEEIVAAAKTRAAEAAKAAEVKAEAEAGRILNQGREQLAHDIEAARRALKAETARLVAATTRAVLRERVDLEADRRLINRSLEEVEV